MMETIFNSLVKVKSKFASVVDFSCLVGSMEGI